MSALLGMQINQVILLFGIGLFAFVLFNRIRRGWGPAGRPPRLGGSWRSGRESALPATRTREVIGSARLRSATASPDQEAWEVEMHRLARQLKAELDTKMRAFEQLIKMADEARACLDTSIERAESLGLSARNDVETTSLERKTSDDGRYTHPGRTPQRRRIGQPMRETVLSTYPHRADDPGEDPRFERVYALADAGFSATKIAGQIGSQVGEVELILSLRDENKGNAA